MGRLDLTYKASLKALAEETTNELLKIHHHATTAELCVDFIYELEAKLVELYKVKTHDFRYHVVSSMLKDGLK